MALTPRLVFVTTPTIEEGRKIAQLLLAEHLAACAQLIPGVESQYWWKDKIESSTEVLLLIKSSAEQFEAVKELIQKHHSYECPEIVAIAPHEISPLYREWWERSLAKI